jgi:ferredoxin
MLLHLQSLAWNNLNPGSIISFDMMDSDHARRPPRGTRSGYFLKNKILKKKDLIEFVDGSRMRTMMVFQISVAVAVAAACILLFVANVGSGFVPQSNTIRQRRTSFLARQDDDVQSNGLMRMTQFQHRRVLATTALHNDRQQQSDTSSISSSIYSDVTKVHVRIPKPMGIILEEIDASDPSQGVSIARLLPKGNAAVVANHKNNGSPVDDALVCMRDKILAVNDTPCSDSSLETVMDAIVAAETSVVELVLGRPLNSTAVLFSNGVAVAAQPGEYLGNVADEARMEIPYSCRSGSCGTCEQSIVFHDDDVVSKKQRYGRPCVYRIPTGVKSMSVVPSDRFLV